MVDMTDRVVSAVVVMILGSIGAFIVYSIVGSFNFGTDLLATALSAILAGIVMAIAVIGAIMLLAKK